MEMNDTSVNDNSSDNVNISEIEEKSFTYFYCPKTEKLIMNCEDSSNRFTRTDCHEFLQNNKISPGFYTCVCQVRKKLLLMLLSTRLTLVVLYQWTLLWIIPKAIHQF